MRRVWGRVWAGALVIAMVLLTGPSPVAARPDPPAPGGGSPARATPGRGETAVTLITGDVVFVGADGRSVRPVPGQGREHIRFLVRRVNDHTYVVPRDALTGLGAGTLDWRLFDVTGLVELGYDDAHRSDLPLLVRSRPGFRPAGVVRQLSTLDLSVVRAKKGTTFWSGQSSARIWLDGVRRPALDRSVPHIGAPAAWAAGYTGTGVSVAVLDSGIDATHPDLAGRVVEARNFTDEPDGDAVGHGTHVASTIAGTGAASGGRYRGVAPDASLLDGKVCGLFSCTESSILAGMEWAAAEKGATVVNMSLGGADFPGIDPLEEAVNRLTAGYGTLFVIAAGNVGRCSIRNRVGSPGSAAAALTVGAMDLDDQLARFSCQGPTIEDTALKPDISAPGVDIVAARVPGTPAGDSDPVDDRYARLSGTSMAAPHVAGAAALLAQEHPDWRADRLKSVLMGSAAANPALTGYQQGSGRVDVARAIGQTVLAAPPSLSLGLQRWPHTDDEPMVRAVTYHNTGSAGVTLSLRLDVTGPDGRPAPAGMFTLSATTVTVPSGGEASVTVTASTRVAGPDGSYTGRVVATDGTTVVGTPIAVEREPESYDVTVRAIDRSGDPTELYVGDIYTPDVPTFFQGSTTVRLPRGGYEVASFVYTPVPDPFGTLSLLGTHLSLTADTTLTLDARLAKPVEVVPPRASAGLPVGMIAAVGGVEGYTYTFGLNASGSYDGLFSGHFGQSSERSRLSSYVYGVWAEPGPNGDFFDSPYRYNLTWYRPGRLFDGLVRHPKDSELAAVRSEYPSPPGRFAIKLDFARLAGVDTTGSVAVQLGFTMPNSRVEYYTTEGVEWHSEVTRYLFDVETFQGTAWRPFHRGQSTERWGIGVLGPALPAPDDAESWIRQFPDTLVFSVPMYSDGVLSHSGAARTDSAQTVMYRNGEEVARSSEAGYVLYQAPAAAGDIRVETTASQSVYSTSTEIRAAWRFKTQPVPGPGGVLLSAMAVRFLPQLDLANSAPGGRPYLLPVTVEHQPGAPAARIVSLTVDVSYDDGQNWHRVPLVPTPTGWLAPLLHPATGFVSLRAKARDADGVSVEETIIRGYALH